MSAAEYFGILGAIYLAHVMPKNMAFAFGLACTVIHLTCLVIGK